MRVVVEDERIVIGDYALRYDPYYFRIRAGGDGYRHIVKDVLSQWASAIAKLGRGISAVYLPYYLDDETCRVLEAVPVGADVVLTSLTIRENAYALDLGVLEDFMVAEPHIIKRSPEAFGRFRREELMTALGSAVTGGA